MNHDITICLFSIFASVLTYQNVRQAVLHGDIKGMHWFSTAFFGIWGVYQIYFYYTLGYIFSMIGGSLIVIIDAYWLYLFWKYNRSDRPII